MMHIESAVWQIVQNSCRVLQGCCRALCTWLQCQRETAQLDLLLLHYLRLRIVHPDQEQHFCELVQVQC